MTSDEQYEADINVALDELRARYGRCNSNYDNLQNKFFALLAGQLAVATLLFSSGFTDGNFHDPTGKVFFIIGAVFLVAAIGIAFMSVSSSTWAEVPELRRILENDEIKAHPGIKFKERIKLDYEGAVEDCTRLYRKRATNLDWSIRSFVVGVILLLMLKLITRS